MPVLCEKKVKSITQSAMHERVYSFITWQRKRSSSASILYSWRKANLHLAYQMRHTDSIHNKTTFAQTSFLLTLWNSKLLNPRCLSFSCFISSDRKAITNKQKNFWFWCFNNGCKSMWSSKNLSRINNFLSTD